MAKKKQTRKRTFKMIPCVDAGDMPEDVLDYCVDNDIQTHYQNDVAQICAREDDFLPDGRKTPLGKWLISIGVSLDKEYNYVAIIST